MVFGKITRGRDGFNVWTINGQSYEAHGAPQRLTRGRRYRLAFDNRSDDRHPLHLHRSVFELTSVDGKRTAGVMKDVDYGFMKVFDVV
ncbi:MAG TPA: multicopper oxidase domain-containing protein [Thermodesulfobacteriota bacterium]